MKRIALIVAAILLSQTDSGYANPEVVPKSPEMVRIQSRLDLANENIEQIKLKREKLIAQLKNIEKRYGEVAGSLRDLGLQIGDKQQRLKHLSKEMQKRQAELKLENAELSKQIKASFVMGKKEQLRLLLNQQDPALASRMMVYYNYLNKSRLKKLAQLKKNIALLEKLEQEKHRETDLLGQVIISQKTTRQGLSETKQQREKLLLELHQEFKAKKYQLGQLEDIVVESQAVIDKLQRKILESEMREISNKQAQQPLDSVVKDIKYDRNGNPMPLVGQPHDAATIVESSASKSFSELKGHLPWPVKGPIVKKFGSPRFDTRWDGVLISAQEGTDIKAVTDGKVVFADWLRGYGMLIIISHGHGYMSLYAFNQSLYKKVDDFVKAGTVIAAVGKSGGREESGVYFGIRNNGKPVDPVPWCKKG